MEIIVSTSQNYTFDFSSIHSTDINENDMEHLTIQNPIFHELQLRKTFIFVLSQTVKDN